MRFRALGGGPRRRDDARARSGGELAGRFAASRSKLAPAPLGGRARRGSLRTWAEGRALREAAALLASDQDLLERLSERSVAARAPGGRFERSSGRSARAPRSIRLSRRSARSRQQGASRLDGRIGRAFCRRPQGHAARRCARNRRPARSTRRGRGPRRRGSFSGRATPVERRALRADLAGDEPGARFPRTARRGRRRGSRLEVRGELRRDRRRRRALDQRDRPPHHQAAESESSLTGKARVAHWISDCLGRSRAVDSTDLASLLGPGTG